MIGSSSDFRPAVKTFEAIKKRTLNDTVISLVDKLSTYKAQYVPEVLRRSVALSWRDRWASMLGIAVQNAIAASLLAPTGRRRVLDQSGAPTPDISTVWDGQRWAVEHSVLPIFD